MDENKETIFSRRCAQKLDQIRREVRSATAQARAINYQVVMQKMLDVLCDEQPIDVEVSATPEQAAKVASA